MKNTYSYLCTDERVRSYLPLFIHSYSPSYNQKIADYSYKGVFVHHIILTLDGEGEVKADNKLTSLTKGKILFYRADYPIKYYNMSEVFRTCFLTFQGIASLPLLDFYNFPSYLVFENDRIANQLIDICKAADNGTREEILSSRVYSLINDIGIYLNSDSLPRSFEKAVSYIRSNYHKDISISDISRYAEISESLLFKQFKKIMGVTPSVYITQVRLNWAKHFLETTPDTSIAEIAKNIGFSNTSYFIETFKKYERITPLQYKKYLSKIK